jgi:hypothetical protein
MKSKSEILRELGLNIPDWDEVVPNDTLSVRDRVQLSFAGLILKAMPKRIHDDVLRRVEANLRREWEEQTCRATK